MASRSPGVRRYKQGFRVQISYTDDQGIRRRPSFYFPHEDTPAGWARAEVERAKLIQQHIIDRPTTPAIEAGSVTDMVQTWLKHRAPHLTQNTHDFYRYTLKPVLDRIGHLPADQITGPALDDMYLDMLTNGARDAKPLTASSVHHAHTTLGTAYRWTIKRGDLTSDPTKQATPPPRSRTEVEPPDQATVLDLLDLLDGTNGPLWRPALVRLAVVTGSRRGELLGLRWSDIDIEAATVRRPRTASATSKGTVVRETSKTGVRLSRVSIDQPTVTAIRRLQTATKETALAAGVPLVGDPWLFPSKWTPDGSEGLAPSAVATWWHRMKQQHPALAGVRWHDLRHFVITQSLAAGVPVNIVAARAGHRDASMVLRTYGHFVPEADREAAAAMSKVLTR